MVGQDALREAVRDETVMHVVTVGRTPTGQQHPKLREMSQANLYDLSAIAEQLTGLDACLFCLSTSASGMNEADYRLVTFDLTIAVAGTLLAKNTALTIIYV